MQLSMACQQNLEIISCQQRIWSESFWFSSSLSWFLVSFSDSLALFSLKKSRGNLEIEGKYKVFSSDTIEIVPGVCTICTQSAPLLHDHFSNPSFVCASLFSLSPQQTILTHQLRQRNFVHIWELSKYLHVQSYLRHYD